MLTAEFNIDRYGDAMKRSGKREGKIEGKIEGKKEGKIEMAIEAIRMGMLSKDIARLTGWSIDEIEKLKNKTDNTKI